MAKVSPVSIKYMVYANFRSEGPLEKPDVIGAIFGQTEGLLGEEMEMRELQKEGKIGRIEVNLETVDGKSVGEIQLPSALDKSETTLVAAALETIDRIGPTEASIEIRKIEDVRGSKRDFILERAKKLMAGMDGGGGLGEMAKELKEDSRVAKITEYGEERLPAGDLSGKEVIVVEGRADVVNCLKNRVNNVIGMAGTKLPKEISRLGEEKELTLFIDGDRGGKLIAGNVMSNAKIAYVANAPDGKEVEELTGKEILMALRKKIKAEEFKRIVLDKAGIKVTKNGSSSSSGGTVSPAAEIKYDGDVKAKVREIFEESVKGTKSAVLLDGNMDIIRKVGLREISKMVRGSRTPVAVVVLEGSATGAIVKACEEGGVKVLGATNFGSVGDTGLDLVSL